MYFNSEISDKRRRIHPAILVIVSAISSLGLAFVGEPVVAGVLVGVSAAALIVTAERKPMTVLVLFGFISFFFTEEGISLVAIVLTLIAGCGIYSRALEKLRSPFLWAIPIISFIVGAIVTHDLLLSSLSLAFVLPAAALRFTFTKKYSRVGAICLISGAFMIFFIAFLLADVYRSTGTVSLDVFREGAEIYRESFAKVLMEFQIMDVKTEQAQAVFTELEAKNLANEIVSLFPAFFIIGCNALAYFAQKLMYVIVRREGEEHKFEDKMIALVLSPYAGVTFVLAFLVMTLASVSRDHALAYTVAENVFFIFIPGLAASGIMFQLAKIARFRRGVWVVVLFVMLAFVNVGIAVLLAACTGAYYSIAAPVYAFLNSKKDDDSL